MIAAESTANPDVLLLLLAAGADARVDGPRGETALALGRKNGEMHGTPAVDALVRAAR
jgi:hypothetical protein